MIESRKVDTPNRFVASNLSKYKELGTERSSKMFRLSVKLSLLRSGMEIYGLESSPRMNKMLELLVSLVGKCRTSRRFLKNGAASGWHSKLSMHMIQEALLFIPKKR